jgi:uncharacterized membrane protein
MGLIATIAPFFIAIAMIAFGIQHLVYGEFVTRVIPKLPAWIPWHAFWADLTGCVLIAAGAAILIGKQARAAALLLGSLLLLSFLVFYLPALLVSPPLSPLWTNAGKALALSGGSFLVAASITQRYTGSPIWYLDRLIPLSRVFLSAFLIVAGIQHFMYPTFVATLVPGWIPGHMFWTYFAGVALIAGGVGMLIPKVAHLAAFLSGVMIFLWVLLLHIPRALAAPHNSNETTAVFEALAMSGTAFMVAALSGKSVSRYRSGGSYW